nr:tyrosine-type recombinase/integrase [Lapillicoccus sp.]
MRQALSRFQTACRVTFRERARLGLRAGEVAALGLKDVDWRAATMTVRGKGSHTGQLPLPPAVGQAITDYLQVGHPGSTVCGALFVRVHAPAGGLTRGAVSNIVAAKARRAGLGTIHAHRLRHTAATAILLSGGSLEEVGQVLAHRRSATTTIYAKVDVDTLRSIARPWPATPATYPTEGVLT